MNRCQVHDETGAQCRLPRGHFCRHLHTGEELTVLQYAVWYEEVVAQRADALRSGRLHMAPTREEGEVMVVPSRALLALKKFSDAVGWGAPFTIPGGPLHLGMLEAEIRGWCKARITDRRHFWTITPAGREALTHVINK